MPYFHLFALYIFIVASFVYTTSCTSRYAVYFNTYYNANKFFTQALEKKENRLKENPLDTLKVSTDEEILFKKAIQKSSKVLKLYSKKNQTYIPQSLNILISSYYNLGNCEKVIQYYQKFLHFYPNQKLNLFHYLECSLLEKATVFNKDKLVLETDKIQNKKIKISILQKIAELEEQDDRLKKAIDIYQKILLEPSISKLKKNLFLLKQTHLYSHLNNWERASETFKKIKTEKFNKQKKFQYYKLKIQIIDNLQSREKAIEDLKKTIQNKSYIDNESELIFLLSTWFIKNKQVQSAYIQWNKILELDLKKQNLWRAKALYELTQYYYYYDNNLEKSKKYSSLCQETNQTPSKQCKDFSNAVRKIERLNQNNLITHDSIQNQNYFNIAEIFLWNLHQTDSSITYLNKFMTKPISTKIRDKALFNLANIYENFKIDLNLANDIYKQIIQEYPNTIYSTASQKKLYNTIKTPSLNQIALSLYQKAEQKPKQAISLLEQLLEKYPTVNIYTKAQLKLAQLYEQKYNHTEKLKHLYLARKNFYQVSISKVPPYDSIAKKKTSHLNLSEVDNISSKIELKDVSVYDFFKDIYDNHEYYEENNSNNKVYFEEEEEIIDE